MKIIKNAKISKYLVTDKKYLATDIKYPVLPYIKERKFIALTHTFPLSACQHGLIQNKPTINLISTQILNQTTPFYVLNIPPKGKIDRKYSGLR